MTIFGQSRLGRMSYVFIALLMLVFDFGKAPIEKLIVSQHDQVAEQLLNPQPATPDEIKRLSQVQNMFAPSDDVGEQRLTPHRATRQEMEQSKRLKDIGFQGNFQREVLQEYMKSDSKMTDKQFEARVTQLAVKSLWDMAAISMRRPR